LPISQSEAQEIVLEQHRLPGILKVQTKWVVLNLMEQHFGQELEDIALISSDMKTLRLGHLLLCLLDSLELPESDAINLPQMVVDEPLPLLVQPLLRLADIDNRYLDCFLNTPNAYHLSTTTGLSPAAYPFSSEAYPAVCPINSKFDLSNLT
jgi:hypothetical protein